MPAAGENLDKFDVYLKHAISNTFSPLKSQEEGRGLGQARPPPSGPLATPMGEICMVHDGHFDGHNNKVLMY